MSNNVQNQLSQSESPSGGSSSKSSGFLSSLGNILGIVSNPLAGLLNTGLGFLSSSIQKDDAREQWERENEYNLPKNQIQRLKDAGLNPALMYQNGASGLLSAQSPELSKSGQPQLQGLDPLTSAQIANINADTQRTKAETKKTGEETNQIILDNFFRDFNKGIVEKSADSIRDMAKQIIKAQEISSINEVYQSLYSAGILAAFFDYDENSSYDFGDGNVQHFYDVGGYYYSQDVHDKFKALGLSATEQTLLERSLYKSYVDAQKKVNKRAGEEADMNVVIPEMINEAPKWLKPILVILNNWFNNGHMPSFIYSPNKSVTTNSTNNTESFKNKIFNH